MKYLLKSALLVIVLMQIFAQKTYSQTVVVPDDKLEFTVKKVKAANSIFNASTVHFTNENVFRIKINLKMKTEKGKRVMFDPNKFSFLDNDHKIRLRPTDITFQNMTDFWSFSKCSKQELKKEKKRLLYKPELEDTYYNYSPMGYKNQAQPVNYGNKKNPDLHIVFFHPKKMRNRNLHLFVVVPKSMKNGNLYYGDTKLMDINMDQL